MCERLSIELFEASHTDIMIYDLYRLQGTTALKKLFQNFRMCEFSPVR